MKTKYLQRIIIQLLVVFLALSPLVVSAYQIQDLSDTPVQSDFVLGPGKSEIWLEPGETVTRELLITNRLGRAMGFKMEIEDFEGSYDTQSPVVFMGEQKSPYSLKDYLKPEILEFTLSHGQRIVLPVTISIPADAEPGGRYGAVILTTNPKAVSPVSIKDEVKSGVTTIARIASLFFIRVKGPIEEKGSLKSFALSGNKSFYEKGPISFQILYQNEGTIHLAPYGLVEISNIFGKKIGEVSVDPYFAMPDSLRSREVKWDADWGFGKYTAKLSLNKGFQNQIETRSVEFWIIPWKIVLAGILIISILAFLIIKIGSKFEIRLRRTS